MVDQNSIPSGQKFLVGAQTPRQMELIQELRQAGASVAELPTGPVNPEPTAFEGQTFQTHNGFRYDSRAAWYVTWWSHLVGLNRGHTMLQSLGGLMEELQESPKTPVRLANSHYLEEAEVFTLTDGSMVIAAIPEAWQSIFSLFRFTGELREDEEVWLDWGLDPPVASVIEPLPGNQAPQVSSLKIG